MLRPDQQPPLDFTDPKTGLLYNLKGATSQSHLDQMEADLSTRRLHQLIQPRGTVPAPAITPPPVPLRYDEPYLRRMHAYLFQDIYPWAGETRADRNFQGQKTAADGYYLSHANYRRITPDLAAISAQLSQENGLKGLNKETFVKRAAYYMDHYNHVHSFREGNGRTVQALFHALGKEAGYRVNLTPEKREFNPARDEALLARRLDPASNLTRLESLLRRNVQELPGREAAENRNPRHARPLSAPTPEVARIEALRELKASSQAVSLRLNEQRGPERKDVLFLNLQAYILPNPDSITRLAPALFRQAEDAAQSPERIQNGAPQLNRFIAAITRVQQLYAPGKQLAPPTQTLPPPEPGKEQKGKKEGPAETKKAPTPKRKGPSL